MLSSLKEFDADVRSKMVSPSKESFVSSNSFCPKPLWMYDAASRRL